MKKISVALLGLFTLIALSGCSLSLLRTPVVLPTQVVIPSSTPPLATPTLASPSPTATGPTPTLSLPTVTPGASGPTPGGIELPTATVGAGSGVSSGPYGVIRIALGDVLNIRSGAGAGYSVTGSFVANAADVMRTGPSSIVDGDLWVQVQEPGGGSGWVNAIYLTEYVAPTTFCADSRINTLITNFGAALKTSNGETLSALVSPVHGLAVRLWRYADAVVFDRDHARWMFDSTFEHDWGAAPGSGLETIGSFHVVVLPKLVDVINTPAPGYILSCNAPLTGGASYDPSWPSEYTNVNFYSLYKPGPVGNELSWQTLLVGVEFVQNQPYVFSVTQMGWEP